MNKIKRKGNISMIYFEFEYACLMKTEILSFYAKDLVGTETSSNSQRLWEFLGHCSRKAVCTALVSNDFA